MQFPQPMQMSGSTVTTPLSSMSVAPVGQSAVQGCSAHSTLSREHGGLEPSTEFISCPWADTTKWLP